jgi:hypothetical protein
MVLILEEALGMCKQLRQNLCYITNSTRPVKRRAAISNRFTSHPQSLTTRAAPVTYSTVLTELDQE